MFIRESGLGYVAICVGSALLADVERVEVAVDAVAKRDLDDELVMGTDHAVRVETEVLAAAGRCNLSLSLFRSVPNPNRTRDAGHRQTSDRDTEREKACGRVSKATPPPLPEMRVAEGTVPSR